MERESRDVDLHQVRKVLEVRANAANELLDAGWILHDIYFCNGPTDYHSNYILLTTEPITCPSCGGLATVEVVDNGDRIRYICTQECPEAPGYPSLDMAADRTI